MRSIYQLRAILGFSILFGFSNVTGYAQGTAAQMSGLVADATGAAIPNARITIVNKDTAARREVHLQ